MLIPRRFFQRGRWRRILLPLVPVHAPILALALLTVIIFLSGRFRIGRGTDLFSFLRPSAAPASFSQSPIPAVKATANAAAVATKAEAGACQQPELAHLRNSAVDLTETIRYSRRCVRPVFGQAPPLSSSSPPSSSLTSARRKPVNVPGPLFTKHQVTVNLTDCQTAASSLLLPCEPLELHVSRPYPAGTYPHLVFGVSSSYERMLHALDGFAFWLGGSDAQLVAIVQGREGTSRRDYQKDQETLDALEKAYRARGVQLRAMAPQNRSLTVVQNHLAVLASMLEATAAAKTAVRWLAVVDDDTFFPSLYKLNQALQQHNHSQPVWLGALSEDFDSVSMFGYMAYGGAGVFVSVPLAQKLVPHMDECLAGVSGLATATIAAKISAGLAGGPSAFSSTVTGDGLLRDCIYQHTATKLTILPGLYQHDLYGDLAGFYESGVAPPLSVHHWRSWYKAPLPQMAAVNALCGDCFLGRWLFEDDVLLANGYSVAKYSLHTLPDFAQMEATWSHTGREFDFSLGPLRQPLVEDEKKSYRLVVAEGGKEDEKEDEKEDTKNKNFRQVYVYKGDFIKDEVDEVFELIWET